MSAVRAPYYDTNTLVDTNEAMLEFVSGPSIGTDLAELAYDWDTGSLNCDCRAFKILSDLGLTDGTALTRLGILFLSRLLFHFDIERRGASILGSLNEKYDEFSTLSVGKNSTVLVGRHRLLGTKFVLKLLRPGASDNLAASAHKLSALSTKSAIVRPIDFQRVTLADALGKRATLDCLVFPFIEGKTLRDFLFQPNHHLNSQIAIAFARQVGSALAELEAIGAYHGDLHERNIIVDEYSDEGLRFRIVDISFDAMGSLTFEICRNNDLWHFKQHIWRLLREQRSFLPNLSILKYVGTRSYIKINKILSDETSSFQDVMSVLEDEREYGDYRSNRTRFLNEHFIAPTSFRLQRYEEITDPRIAVSLFVPFDELFQKISSFGNVYVSGNRGSGKSTYLAALAFFPEVEAAPVDVGDIFGVYFPCRQGEFRPLKARPGWPADAERTAVTNIVIMKIIRRTLEMISAGIAIHKLSHPTEIQLLRTLISEFVPPPGIVYVSRDIQSEIDNLVSTMVRVEMRQVLSLMGRPLEIVVPVDNAIDRGRSSSSSVPLCPNCSIRRWYSSNVGLYSLAEV